VKIIIDAKSLRLYPVGKPGFSGGTEEYARVLARGLARRNTVHVITPDLDMEEQRGPTEWWWPPMGHPTAADVVVKFHDLTNLNYDCNVLVWASNGVGADLDGQEAAVDAVACFSQEHVDLLANSIPAIGRDKFHITGLGVDVQRYPKDDRSVPGRIFVSNDPVRGLWHVLDVFDCVRREVPGATLHVGYDFERQFESRKWAQNIIAERMWETRRRLCSTPGVVSLGALSPEQVTLEQIEAQVHVWPSDPPNLGSQIHGITQMECAAAGCVLVLSDIEAFPEVFKGGAIILPVIGKFFAGEDSRVSAQDYAGQVVRVMQDEEYRAKWRRKAQLLAAKHTWAKVVARWESMLAGAKPTEDET
jgi:glycosyltransferase involved in cell wall biosynthesis